MLDRTRRVGALGTAMYDTHDRLDASKKRALVELGELLRDEGYHFVAVTPTTHATVNQRANVLAANLRDVFGWNRPFLLELLPPEMREALAQADALVPVADGFRSAVRFASLGDDLYVHSAFPTIDADAVFFGPDTYRFVAFLERARVRGTRAVDVGAGGGAGGIVSRRFADEVVLADVNPRAIDYAEINVRLAEIDRVDVVYSDVLRDVPGEIDLVVSNPPFMRDPLGRTYRDGGGELGEGLAVRIAEEALARLPKGGKLVLYTGAPVVAGRDVFLAALVPRISSLASDFTYEELDPDIFGESLGEQGYAGVERIAAVGLVATR